jgi:hypothetical protein
MYSWLYHSPIKGLKIYLKGIIPLRRDAAALALSGKTSIENSTSWILQPYYATLGFQLATDWKRYPAPGKDSTASGSMTNTVYVSNGRIRVHARFKLQTTTKDRYQKAGE